jgi:hypothetical protein
VYADRLGEVCGGELVGRHPIRLGHALSFIGGAIERESTAGAIRHLVESGECCRLVSMNSQLPGFVAPAQLAPVLGSVAHRHPPRQNCQERHWARRFKDGLAKRASGRCYRRGSSDRELGDDLTWPRENRPHEL